MAARRVWRFQGERLRELRRSKGFERAEALAERMHDEPACEAVTRDMVYRWEKGTAQPSVPSLLALETIFRVPVRKWYETVEAPEPEPPPAPEPTRPTTTAITTPSERALASLPVDPEWERRKAEQRRSLEAMEREERERRGE